MQKIGSGRLQIEIQGAIWLFAHQIIGTKHTFSHIQLAGKIGNLVTYTGRIEQKEILGVQRDHSCFWAWSKQRVQQEYD